MLKGIDQRLSADLIHAMMLMGHGDDLVICDVNHPAATIAAATTLGRLIDMPGCDILTATRAILSLMPLDSFVPAPVARMQVVGDPAKILPLFTDMQTLCSAVEGRKIDLQALDRFAFYTAAKQAFCIIRTSDSGPYGCFILKKGVVDLPPLTESWVPPDGNDDTPRPIHLVPGIKRNARRAMPDRPLGRAFRSLSTTRTD